MAKLRIDEGELLEAVSSGDGSMLWYLDLQTGELWPSNEYEISWRGDPREIAALDAATFDPQSIQDPEQLSAIMREMTERFVAVDRMASHDGFRLMEDFASTQDDAIRARLFDALDRRRPFRSFKDALLEFDGLRDQWSDFEADRQRAWALDWLASIGVEAELHSGPSTGTTD